MKKVIYLVLLAGVTLGILMFLHGKYNLNNLTPTFGEPEEITNEEAQEMALNSLKKLFADINSQNKEEVDADLENFIYNPDRNEPSGAEEFIDEFYPYDFLTKTNLTIIPKEDIKKDAIESFGNDKKNGSIWISSHYEGSSTKNLSRIFVMNRSDDGEFYLSSILYFDKEFDGASANMTLKDGVKDVYIENALPFEVKPGNVAYTEETENFFADDELKNLLIYLFDEQSDSIGSQFYSAQRMDEQSFLVKTDKVDAIIKFKRSSSGKKIWIMYEYGTSDTILQSKNWEGY